MPERDAAKPAESQGLFRKFEVRRTDGSDAPGGKHHGCEHFVLDVTHDVHAKAALAAYADAVAATHPELAADMRRRYALADRTTRPAGEAQKLGEQIKEEFDYVDNATAWWVSRCKGMVDRLSAMASTSSDAEDARRYRGLKDSMAQERLNLLVFFDDTDSNLTPVPVDELDARVDAALAQQAAPGESK